MTISPAAELPSILGTDLARFKPQTTADFVSQIYAADPLVCPRCGGRMNVIAVIEQDDGIFRMLSHLGLVPAEELVYVPVFDDLLFPEAA